MVDGAVVQDIETGELSHVECDVICLAVGLTPTNEMLWQAGCEMRYIPQLCGHVPLRGPKLRTSHPDIWIAGDAAGIEEASSAMVEGRIAGLAAAQSLGFKADEGKFDEYHERLAALRRGEAGEKIRSGLALAQVDDWRDE